jgi:hypothetical protein
MKVRLDVVGLFALGVLSMSAGCSRKQNPPEPAANTSTNAVTVSASGSDAAAPLNLREAGRAKAVALPKRSIGAPLTE